MKKLALPPDLEELRSLEPGRGVLLNGPALTMRDAALGRLASLVDAGESPGFALAGELVFYAGPSPAAAGRPCGAIGPTTSARMDPFLQLLFELGVRVTLGKGPRSPEAVALHRKYGAVYLAAVGGIAALHGGKVYSIEPIAWEDLGPEAVSRIVFEQFPATVAVDARGTDFLASRYGMYGSGQQ